MATETNNLENSQANPDKNDFKGITKAKAAKKKGLGKRKSASKKTTVKTNSSKGEGFPFLVHFKSRIFSI